MSTRTAPLPFVLPAPSGDGKCDACGKGGKIWRSANLRMRAAVAPWIESICASCAGRLTRGAIEEREAA